jgi:hypothetical protein
LNAIFIFKFQKRFFASGLASRSFEDANEIVRTIWKHQPALATRLVFLSASYFVIAVTVDRLSVCRWNENPGSIISAMRPHLEWIAQMGEVGH